MPHELSIAANGDAEMFFVGKTPWHGLGQELDNPATAEEAIRAAHLDWTVSLEPVYEATNLGPPNGQVEPYRFVRRSDNGAILGMRTKAYSPVQNVGCFSLFDAVIGPGEGVYETAGALKGGKVVWILAKVGDSREVVPGDIVEPYILLSTSHDGSLPLSMRPTVQRVVCKNTLDAALNRGNKSDIVTIRHSGDVAVKAVAARKALRLSGLYFSRMMEGIEALVAKQMNGADVTAFTNSLLRPWKHASEGWSLLHREEVKTHRFLSEGREKLEELFVTGRGQELPGVRGTAWAAYNATTEYVDYWQRVGRGAIGEPDDGDRLYKSWFGTGKDLKMRAWSLLQGFCREGNIAFTPPVANDA